MHYIIHTYLQNLPGTCKDVRSLVTKYSIAEENKRSIDNIKKKP